jgi:primosomal protein N' (replication factor Y)
LPKSIVKVALDVPLNRLFDYLSDNSEIRIGQRVLVPFGRRNQIGIVLSQSDSSDYPIEMQSY